MDAGMGPVVRAGLMPDLQRCVLVRGPRSGITPGP